MEEFIRPESIEIEMRFAIDFILRYDWEERPGSGVKRINHNKVPQNHKFQKHKY